MAEVLLAPPHDRTSSLCSSFPLFIFFRPHEPSRSARTRLARVATSRALVEADYLSTLLVTRASHCRFLSSADAVLVIYSTFSFLTNAPASPALRRARLSSIPLYIKRFYSARLRDSHKAILFCEVA